MASAPNRSRERSRSPQSSNASAKHLLMHLLQFLLQFQAIAVKRTSFCRLQWAAHGCWVGDHFKQELILHFLRPAATLFLRLHVDRIWDAEACLHGVALIGADEQFTVKISNLGTNGISCWASAFHGSKLERMRWAPWCTSLFRQSRHKPSTPVKASWKKQSLLRGQQIFVRDRFSNVNDVYTSSLTLFTPCLHKLNFFTPCGLQIHACGFTRPPSCMDENSSAPWCLLVGRSRPGADFQK